MNNLDFGVIGNCQSGALISKYGNIEWCCLPCFDSSSVFASILDKENGGIFAIIPEKGTKIDQEYVKNTNILKTTFKKGKNIFQVLDFMPRYNAKEDPNCRNAPDIIRYFRLISGSSKFAINYYPRLRYAKGTTISCISDDYIKSTHVGNNHDSVYLYTDFDKKKVSNGEILELNESKFFLLSYHQKILTQDIDRIEKKYQYTKTYWLNWSDRTRRFSNYTNEINRSALVLKLLNYDRSGSVLAAMTTSLPETIGEERNWDYRFCWVRDASMVIKVMTQLGHLNYVSDYFRFITGLFSHKGEGLQIMYGIKGEKKLSEHFLTHLEGYKKSSPVRIGNAAYKQKQHDIYGVLMDAILQYFNTHNIPLLTKEELWNISSLIVKDVKETWEDSDSGIWELRTEKKHFTFSKVLCWVAVDRAIKIAELIGKTNDIKKWTPLRNQIKENVIKHAWNEETQAFTQHYGAQELDASVLLMEYYDFLPATNEKYIKTVLAIKKHLMKDGLMYRYKGKDDFGLPSSSFTICTFWMINSLYKIGEKVEAKQLFEKLLSYSNHLGLFSEDIDFKTKRLLGNFPQAYSHLALIETAITLSGGKTDSVQEILNDFS